MFTKIDKKKTNKLKKCSKGFSLIEIVVAVTILAVLTAVISPIMFQYVERSRANRDLSAMDDVSSSFTIGMTDFDAYNEIVKLSREKNVSCYIDTPDESGYSKIITGTSSTNTYYYTFDSSARQLDATPYVAAGKMYGLTITFEPSTSRQGESHYLVRNGIINKFMQQNDGVLGDTAYLYEYVQKVLGDTIEITSNTYKNSDLTIFIDVGETIQAYGQHNGTNLPEGAQDPTMPPQEEPTIPPTERPTTPVLKDPSVVLTAISRTYNGEYQEIVSYSNLVGGTIQFYISRDENDKPSLKQIDKDVCQALDAGIYYVWYKLIADDSGDYKNTGVLYFGQVEMLKVTPSVDITPLHVNCTGGPQDVASYENLVGDKILFYIATNESPLDGSEVFDESCQKTDAGTYYIWYKIIVGTNGNYTDSQIIGPVKATITHEYEEHITQWPTCTNYGYYTSICKCGASTSGLKNPYGHSYASSVVPRSCLSGGYTKYTCKNCGHSYTADHTLSYGGHLWSTTGIYIGTTKYYTCQRCPAINPVA